jgi:Na+/H+ antiporter
MPRIPSCAQYSVARQKPTRISRNARVNVAMSTLIFGMLVLIAAFAVIARWLRLPYPIVFVIGGGCLALIPGLPPIQLQPDLVFLLFLPPLLYGGGFQTDWRDFKRYVTPIIALAVGLVVFTTIVVAFVAHAFIGLPIAAAFVLGAVVSPPDAVATEAIAHELPLPRALKTILSGESLINDATALVIYRFAVAAVASGTFSVWAAGWQFAYVSIAGILIGAGGISLMAGILMFLRRKQLADETVSVLFSLITPYVVYLAAEALHASGVLAAVTAGVLTAQKISRIFDQDARIASHGVWTVLTFSLNGVLFMLIGLQLRFILGALHAYSPATLLGYGALISATVIVVRFAWVYPITLLRKRFVPALGSLDETLPSPRVLFILSWAGMRGIVTLATALAIPTTVRDGGPFPDRDLMLFLAFCVILVTLVGQGLTLPWFIRTIPATTENSRDAIAFARAHTAQAGLAALLSLEPTFATTTHWEIAGRMREVYERLMTFEAMLDAGRANGDGAAAIAQQLQLAAISAEREALAPLGERGEIRADVYRELEWDLDLLASRFSSNR